MRNQIFLPGIDPETGAYASAMLGSTTVLSRTEVDATGTKNDAERVSESRRDLKQAPELRRMVKYRQGIAIIDTADPILFRFLARGDTGDVAIPPERAVMAPARLSEAVAAMNSLREAAPLEDKSNAIAREGDGNSPTVRHVQSKPVGQKRLSAASMQVELITG